MHDFETFFAALTEKKPHGWQKEFAKIFKSDSNCLQQGTGSGKSLGLLAAWFYNLYVDAVTGETNRTHTRLAYTINRRTLVDQFWIEAKRISSRLENPSGEHRSVLKDVADAIKARYDCTLPLKVYRMRGDLRPADRQKIDLMPNQPAIISCTAEQVGRTILFRTPVGSWKVAPHYAGMMMMDTLIAVDEVQMSRSFVRTTQACLQQQSAIGNVPASRLIFMSATVPGIAEVKEFETQPHIFTCDKSVDVNLVESKTFSQDCKKFIKSDVDKKKNLRVIVVCNTVRSARETFDSIREIRFKNSTTIALYHGKMRSMERTSPKVKACLKALSPKARNRKINILVTTQAVEAGLDLSCDLMITQCASVDSVVQRLGRCNRWGENPKAKAFIVLTGKDDPVYGDLAAKTFNFLLVENGKNFNLAKKPIEIDESLFIKEPYAAKLSPDMIRILSETSARRNIEVGPYMSGVKPYSSSEVFVVYRKEITNQMLCRAKDEEWHARLKNWLRVKPVRKFELVPLTISTLKGAFGSDLTDFEPDPEEGAVPFNTVGLRWSDHKIINLKKAQPGDVIVVPASVGNYDEFGFNPGTKKEVDDVFGCCPNDHVTVFENVGEIIQNEYDYNDEKFVDEKSVILQLTELVKDYNKKGLRAYFLKETYKAFLNAVESKQNLKIFVSPDFENIYVWWYSPRKRPTSVGLLQHSLDVEKFGKIFGRVVNMPELFGKFGYLHDLGKGDPDFQKVVRGVFNPQEPLAKGVGGGIPRSRHEMQSIVTAIIAGQLSTHDEPLLTHLIGSHHGYCRPLTKPINPDKVDFTEYKFHMGEKVYEVNRHFVNYPEVFLTNRLFHKLSDQYGEWGLAYLEYVARSADWQASMEN